MTMVDGFFTDIDDIHEWFRLNVISRDEYRINTDLTVSAILSTTFWRFNRCEFEHLPVRIAKAGSIVISSTVLKSLKGLPADLGGELNLDECRALTSLEHCSRRIGLELDLPKNLTSLVGIAEHIDSVAYKLNPSMLDASIYVNTHAITTGGLGLLLIEGAKISDAIRNGPFRIIGDHLKGDKDIFACQQELIDAGLEEYAQL